MTSERDFERLLDGWLSEGPNQVADRVIDDVASRIVRQPQRPAWRLRPWRFPTMSTQLRLAAIVGALLVAGLAGGAIFLSAGGSRPSPVPFRPSPSPLATLPAPTAPASAAAATAVACQDGIPGCAGALAAGQHQTAHFSPAFEYQTPTGWANTIDTGALFTLWPDDSVYATSADLIMVWSNVVPAERPASCVLGPAPGGENSVDGWMAYLASHPGLKLTNQRTVDLAGSTGQAVDLTVDGAWVPPCAEDAATKSAPLVTTVGGGGLGDGYGSTSAVRVRFYSIELGSSTVVITVHVYGSPSEQAFNDAAGLAESVIDTFSFACKADSGPGPCWGPPDASGNPATPPPTP